MSFEAFDAGRNFSLKMAAYAALLNAQFMKQSSTKLAYVRRDDPGQMLLDFGAGTVVAEAPRADVQRLERAAALPVIKPSINNHVEPPPEVPLELQQLADSARRNAASENVAYLTDARVAELIQRAAQEFRPGEVRGVRVRFMPFRSTLYSFRLDRRNTAVVKFHLAFRKSCEAAVLQAAQLMLCRSRKTRLALPRAEYDRFVRSLSHGDFKLPGARKGTRKALGAQGIHRHLEDSFKRVNTAYFSAQLAQPELCWSPARARRILGSYQERHDRLIISRVFDSPSVPPFVLDFLMYHELLHKFLGIGRRNDGKRCIHSPEFKRLERRFERYTEAQAAIKKL